jgi:hypothetical protein
MTGYGLQKQFYEWLAETDEPVTPCAHSPISLHNTIVQPFGVEKPNGYRYANWNVM